MKTPDLRLVGTESILKTKFFDNDGFKVDINI